MSEATDTRPGLLALVWDRLALGVADAGAAARHPTLVTLGRDGRPQARTVALRRADRAAAEVEMHTDVTSIKVTELQADRRAGLHIWDPAVQLQIRLDLDVTVLTGAAARALWSKVPDASRMAYGVTPPPGTEIGAPNAYDRRPNPDQFARLVGRIQRIEAVLLADDYHRRANYVATDGWSGRWLAP